MRAYGLATHVYVGAYAAIIVLSFDSENAARHARAFLGVDTWRHGTDPSELVGIFPDATSDAFEARIAPGLTVRCSARTCKTRCRDESITGNPHHDTRGPSFVIDFAKLAGWEPMPTEHQESFRWTGS